MNDDQIQDLKQFIVTHISQQTSDLREDLMKLEQKIDGVEAKLTNKIDGVEVMLEKKIDDVEAKVDTILETTGAQLVDHETRISSLEQAAA